MTNLHTEVRFSIVPEWVIDADISDRAVRVYGILARYADSETLQAFPSRETLAKRARCHWRSIDRAIDELVKLGAVTKTHRKNGDAYQSNVYTLRRVLTGVSLGTDTGDGGVLTGESVGTDTGGNLTITTELEPLEREPLNTSSESFDHFWNVYPRKQGKGKAKEAFMSAVKSAGVDAVMAGAVRYATDPNLPDPQFVPLPTTWLNQERWDDGALPLNRKMTNSERNIQSLRADLALSNEQAMKEVEGEQVRGQSVIDFGVNFRSADSV